MSEKPTPELPSLVDGMPHDDYRAVEALSYSGMKAILRSPAHFVFQREHPRESTEAMQFGSAVHCGIAEPDAFNDRYCLMPEVDKRTKEGKEVWATFMARNVGKVAFKTDTLMRIRACVEAVRAHRGAAWLLDGAIFERSLFWRDARYGVSCKCRWDLSSHGGVSDIKTTTDASPEAFRPSIENFLYHAQGAHYLSGGEHVLDATPQFFALIAVESEPPHAVACYWVGSASILAGSHLADRALQRYAEASRRGEWVGYPETIEKIEVSRRALRFDY